MRAAPGLIPRQVNARMGSLILQFWMTDMYTGLLRIRPHRDIFWKKAEKSLQYLYRIIRNIADMMKFVTLIRVEEMKR